ncbi:uncharacterized protein LOC134240569 [Saccostrea cucullata]|uniref:uncharacterized protein LOC134240569 n=1 Tax=Saccostrea cuccullata TaxID=36930 RepID=UPI002ECFE05F
MTNFLIGNNSKRKIVTITDQTGLVELKLWGQEMIDKIKEEGTCVEVKCVTVEHYNTKTSLNSNMSTRIVRGEIIEGDTSSIFVGRNNLWEDTNSEVKLLSNIRFPLEVNFYGEQSEDLGGPRKEFLRLVLAYLKSSILEPGVPVKLRRNGALIENQSYYSAGVIVGLSALQNGPCANFLGSLMDNWPQSEPEEYALFRKGLERVGLWQLIRQKPSLLYLFREQGVRLSVSKFVNTLKPRFSEDGTNKRSKRREYTLSSLDS